MQALGKIRVVVVDVDVLGPRVGDRALTLASRFLEPGRAERGLRTRSIDDTGVAKVMPAVERWYLSGAGPGIAPHRCHQSRTTAIDERVDGAGNIASCLRIAVRCLVTVVRRVGPLARAQMCDKRRGAAE